MPTCMNVQYWGVATGGNRQWEKEMTRHEAYKQGQELTTNVPVASSNEVQLHSG